MASQHTSAGISDRARLEQFGVLLSEHSPPRQQSGDDGDSHLDDTAPAMYVIEEERRMLDTTYAVQKEIAELDAETKFLEGKASRQLLGFATKQLDDTMQAANASAALHEQKKVLREKVREADAVLSALKGRLLQRRMELGLMSEISSNDGDASPVIKSPTGTGAQNAFAVLALKQKSKMAEAEAESWKQKDADARGQIEKATSDTLQQLLLRSKKEAREVHDALLAQRVDAANADGVHEGTLAGLRSEVSTLKSLVHEKEAQLETSETYTRATLDAVAVDPNTEALYPLLVHQVETIKANISKLEAQIEGEKTLDDMVDTGMSPWRRADLAARTGRASEGDAVSSTSGVGGGGACGKIELDVFPASPRSRHLTRNVEVTGKLTRQRDVLHEEIVQLRAEEQRQQQVLMDLKTEVKRRNDVIDGFTNQLQYRMHASTAAEYQREKHRNERLLLALENAESNYNMFAAQEEARHEGDEKSAGEAEELFWAGEVSKLESHLEAVKKKRRAVERQCEHVQRTVASLAQMALDHDADAETLAAVRSVLHASSSPSPAASLK